MRGADPQVCTVNNSIFDIWLTLIFGVLGYLFIKVRAPRAALLFGFVLGPQFDGHFREVMQSSGGDILVFLTRPISAALLLLAVFVLIVPFLPAIRARRAAAQA
jgi:TctA family transporter